MLLGKWHRQTCHKPAICFKKRVQYLWRTMKRIAIKRSVPVLAGKHSFVQTILQVGRDVFNTSSCEDGSHVLGMAEKKTRRRRLDADATAVPSHQPLTPCIQPSWYVSNKLILFKLLLWGREMATHSSVLAWRIPWTEKPGRLQSMGSLRVGHNWVTLLSLFTFMHWRRKWQPTPVFLPGESQGRGSLVGCRLWGCRVGHDWSDLAAAAASWGRGFSFPKHLEQFLHNINVMQQNIQLEMKLFEWFLL